MEGFQMKLVLALCAASILASWAVSSEAANITVLHRFSGADGNDPQTALTLGGDGRLYGTTLVGGQFDRGTVFVIDVKTGELVTLHSFASDEGANPLGQLVWASDGNFYGTTRSGGDDNINCAGGCGTIYRISPSGDYETLHFMLKQEGSSLQGGLIEGTDGRLYGTATVGGVPGCGTVYAFSRADSKVKVLHTFNCATDGRYPYGRLVQATNGLLYGTTSEGASAEQGTAYRLKPNGSHFLTLAQFADADAGCQPKAGLIQASNGDLYGATEDCGTYGAGALYSVTLKGAISAIYHFDNDGYARDGKNPTAELLQAPDGKLYGAAPIGGLPVEDPDRSGTVFRVNLKETKFKVLHTFTRSPDGSYPTTALTLGPDGNLYGVTPVGGSDVGFGMGTVYRLKLVK
jgi:uncharacterized repeat protein (TIGR03803 family)